LTRRFEAGIGLPLRSWRRHLRVFRAIGLLDGGAPVTAVAMDLGYSSASAFIFASREERGSSPHAFTRGRWEDVIRGSSPDAACGATESPD